MPDETTTTAILTRDRIMNTDDRLVKEVEVPEWGGKVLIRALSAKDRHQLEKLWMSDVGNIGDGRLMMVALSVVTPDMEPMFTLDDLGVLGDRAFDPINTIFMAASEFNGMAPKKPGDDKAGDFTETPDEDSSSG